MRVRRLPALVSAAGSGPGCGTAEG